MTVTGIQTSGREQEQELAYAVRSRRGSETRQRTTMVAIRLHPDEYKILAEAAQARHVSLSELLRGSALRSVETSGTREECAATVQAVREVSDFYPDRGATVLGRVYLDADGTANPEAVYEADLARSDLLDDLPDLRHELP